MREARHQGAAALPADLDALKAMTRVELHALWPLVARKRSEPPPAQRSLLAAEIAWRVQAKAGGGLDAQTARVLAKAVREIDRERARDQAGGGESGAAPEATRRRREVSVPPKRPTFTPRVAVSELPASARLVRVWPAGSGTRHEVLVHDGGEAFEYRGERFASLTQIARVITGTHWSGPRFFGLCTRAKPAKQPGKQGDHR